MPALRVPVLCYHAHILGGPDYAGNGHVALAADLARLRARGRRVVPLTAIVAALRGEADAADLAGAVGLSFDDGTLLDVAPVEHPEHGRLPGFLPLLRADAEAHPDRPPHATCFVIASPLARAQTDARELHGLGWLGSDWWLDAEASGLMTIGNHSWDHNNLSASEAPARPRASFHGIDREDLADHEIRQAQALLAELLGHAPRLFAYPYGHVNDYLAGEYLPRHGEAMGLRGAFSTAGAPVTEACDPWKLPRYVHGEHWRSPAELDALLDG
jgi:hypothetical protein